MAELKVGQFIIALGCTGGQHRSATLVETLATTLRQEYPQYCVGISHRELRLDDDGQDEDRDVSESP
jgi:RNase adaptor protein for sRNA GlmZ degradation